MNMEKRECERLGHEYIGILNHIVYFLEGFPPAKDMINDYTREKLQELCIGLETGELEIIKFGQVLQNGGDEE
jgi:hypothetical protein